MQSIKKTKEENIVCALIALIVFIFYSHTLNYSWKYFDEQIIYNETLLPIGRNVFEVFQYIANFGIYTFFEASNPFYSSITNLRCNPINCLISLFSYALFQRNSFHYHISSLIIHIFNSCVLFLILNKICKEKKKYKSILLASLVLLWALHPTVVESICFITNWVVILSYSFFLITLLLFINNSNSKLIFISFLMSVFICEHSVTLPLILFFYSYINSTSNNLLERIKDSLKRTTPLFIGLFIYLVYFLSLPTKSNFSEYSFSATLERVFWLSPQIFFHFIKLIFFPLHLTIDQTGNIIFAKNLFDSYTIFCSLFMYSIIGALVFFFFRTDTRSKNIIFLISSFLLSLLPFLQIISPTYCLASERYLYLPTFFLILGIAPFIHKIKVKEIYILSVLISLILLYGTRSYIRTFDWKDSITLFSSAYKENLNPILKAVRLQFVGSLLLSPENSYEIRAKGAEEINNSIIILKNHFNKLGNNRNAQEPKVLEFYGLDPKTTQAKTAYFIAFEKYGLETDLKGAYETLKPFIDNSSINDPSVISFYSNILLSLNKTSEAKELLIRSSKKTMSPLTLVPLANIYMQEKNFQESEKILKSLFRVFPYNVQVIEGLANNYYLSGNKKETEHFAQLYKMRMHINSR